MSNLFGRGANDLSFRVAVDETKGDIGALLKSMQAVLSQPGFPGGQQQLRKAFYRIGMILRRSLDRRFATKTDPLGVPWPPVRHATEKIKRSFGLDPDNLLNWSGKLKQSFKFIYTYDMVVLKTTVPYASRVNFGGATASSWRKNMEARMFMGIDAFAQDEISQVVADQVAITLKAALLREKF